MNKAKERIHYLKQALSFKIKQCFFISKKENRQLMKTCERNNVDHSCSLTWWAFLAVLNLLCGFSMDIAPHIIRLVKRTLNIDVGGKSGSNCFFKSQINHFVIFIKIKFSLFPFEKEISLCHRTRFILFLLSRISSSTFRHVKSSLYVNVYQEYKYLAISARYVHEMMCQVCSLGQLLFNVGQ